MNRRLPVAAIMTLMFVSACQQETPTAQPAEIAVETPVRAEAATPDETLVFDASCNGENGSLPESQLRSKLEGLSALPDNYELVDYGPVDYNAFLLFNPKGQFEYLREGRTVKLTGFDDLMAQMSQAEFGKVKGTVEWKPGNRTYRRATVEEYLFRTEDCAKVAEAYLKWAEDAFYSHGPFYKRIRGVVRNKQAIYHVVSGGMYMMDRQAGLEAVFKD